MSRQPFVLTFVLFVSLFPPIEIRSTAGSSQTPGLPSVPGTGCISGTIIDEDGRPGWRPIAIYLLGSNNNWSAEGSTGRYFRCKLPFGRYRVAIYEQMQEFVVADNIELSPATPHRIVDVNAQELLKPAPTVISDERELREELAWIARIGFAASGSSGVRTCPPIRGALTRESVAACLSAAGSFSAPITSTVPAAELALDATTGRVTVASVYQSACSRTGQGASPYTELLRALEQQNLASMHEHSISRAATEISKIKRARDSFCHLALTPEGKRRSSQWRYVKNDAFVIGSVHGWLQPFSGAWEIPIASAQLVAVTGVVADNLNARAEFTWRLVANDLGRLAPGSLATLGPVVQTGYAQFTKYDDGWRLRSSTR